MRKRRIKRTTKQYFIVAFICIVVIGGAAVFTSVVITGQIHTEYQALLDKANMELKRNQRTVYVASTNIVAGEYITEENIEKMSVYSSQPDEIYITQEGLGQIALIDISAGTQLIHEMFTENEISSKLRETEYNAINISTNILNNDTVDIRIAYPNGESYVVLSKKVIKGITADTVTCYLWLEEEELLRMSAAIVDAGLYPGSRLFVTKYIEPSIQQASIVTYTPSISILSLLEKDPNIVERYSQELNKEVRKALENRLADSMDTDVSVINWELQPNNTRNSETILPLPMEKKVSEAALTPTPIPYDKGDDQDINRASNDLGKETLKEAENVSELGSTEDYFYYVQEVEVREGDIEYGE